MQLVTLPLLLALVPLQDGAPADPRLRADPDLEGLPERWEGAMRALHVPGLAVAVVRDGKVSHMQTFGVRDLDAGKPVTPDTIFYIASCTKTYVALALAELAAEGELDLEASVKDHLPRFELPDEDRTVMTTVEDLLCHRAGIDAFPIVFLDAYSGEITADRYYHFLKEAQVAGRVEYTNVNFTLAGQLLEALTGKPWKDALKERVFAPLGMTRTTGYADWMYAQGDVAFPTVPTPEGSDAAAVRKIDATMHAAGGLGTTIDDFARWVRFQVGDGALDGVRLLPKEWLARTHALTGELEQTEGTLRVMQGYGLAWNVGTLRGRRYCQHGGGYVGSAALVSFLPDDGLGVAVLANSDAGAQLLTALITIDVYGRLLGEELPDLLPGYLEQASEYRAQMSAPREASARLSAETLSLAPAAYAGTYASEWWGTLKIAVEDGALTGTLGALTLELSPGASGGADAFHATTAAGMDWEGAFELEEGQVKWALLQMPGEREARFERE